MCGINGFNFQDIKRLKEMNKSIAHRGPDFDGTYFDKQISLGHRRLSIIDLSIAGNQPMTYIHKKRTAIIVFNGEIYNFQEIKKELESKGHKFESNSDTEVILASYLEWGTSCVKKFNGMWAFCIYDPQNQILFLSRDRLGQKPLYYYHENNKFIFSSELKAILKHNIDQTLNKDAVDLYFSLGFIPSPYSIYRKINKLEARQSIIYDLKSNTIKKEYYYDLPKYNPIHNKQQLIKETKKILKEAVSSRMISDVPLGAFLSGGIDSSLIVKEMTKNVKRENINTFSIGFDGKYDETEYIEIVKDLFKTKHHHKYFREKEFKKILPNIFYYYDEPFADPSMFPTIDLSKFARKELKVSLSGDGGDEMFGGYPRHQMAAQMKFLYKLPKFTREILYKLTKGKLKEGIRLSLLPKEKIFSEARPEIYKPKIYKKLTEQKMKEYLSLANNNLMEAILLFDRYFQTLPDNFLTKVDRASMAHGLEVRSPFLDYRFIELSSKIPTKLKSSITKNKILLREIASEILPSQIINRKKTGFTPPIEEWLLKKEYKKELAKMLKKLYKNKIISKEWNTFYQKEAFTKEGIIHQNYLIRLYFFYHWYMFWKHNN